MSVYIMLLLGSTYFFIFIHFLAHFTIIGVDFQREMGVFFDHNKKLVLRVPKQADLHQNKSPNS
jgi:hypothetical protein